MTKREHAAAMTATKASKQRAALSKAQLVHTSVLPCRDRAAEKCVAERNNVRHHACNLRWWIAAQLDEFFMAS